MKCLQPYMVLSRTLRVDHGKQFRDSGSLFDVTDVNLIIGGMESLKDQRTHGRCTCKPKIPKKGS